MPNGNGPSVLGTRTAPANDASREGWDRIFVDEAAAKAARDEAWEAERVKRAEAFEAELRAKGLKP